MVLQEFREPTVPYPTNIYIVGSLYKEKYSPH
jgi:hypothetical protein